MATYTWGMTARDIVASAHRKLGAVSEIDSLSGNQWARGMEALNLALKALQSRDGPSWAKVEADPITTVAGTGVYTITVGGVETAVNRLHTAWIDVGVNTRQLRISTMEEYWHDRYSSSIGMPGCVMLVESVQPSQVRLHPTPSGEYQVTVVVVRKMADFVDLADTLNCPETWLEYLVWEVANQLAPEFGESLQAQQLLAVRSRSARERARIDSFLGRNPVIERV